MAGGKGIRLKSGEKPLATLKERPLIAYVLDTLLKCTCIGRIYVAVSPYTTGTRAFVENEYGNTNRVTVQLTPGSGYIEDTAFAVRTLELFRPFLVVSSDIPLVRSETIDLIVKEYERAGTEALSVRVDLSSVPQDVSTDTILTDNGVENVPAAINIIDGRHMDRYQQEAVLILKDPLLAVNVNYIPDLSVCEKLMSESRLNSRFH